jgi:hypothetical protein
VEAIDPNGGNKKRSGLEAESLSTSKNLQKVIPFQIALDPLCFLLRVSCCHFLVKIFSFILIKVLHISKINITFISDYNTKK